VEIAAETMTDSLTRATTIQRNDFAALKQERKKISKWEWKLRNILTQVVRNKGGIEGPWSRTKERME